jgi:glycosyltransferase involved in cell wall biosynthesis
MITLVSSFFNEEEIVPEFINNLNQILKFQPAISAVLVNNSSTDETYKILLEQTKELKKVKVINNPDGRGYGDGIRTAINASFDQHVIIFPGDLQYGIEDVKKLLSAFFSSSENARSHVNIFTNRVQRLDGKYNSFRGYIFKKILHVFFRLPNASDPASQLRLLCRCCLIKSKTPDFTWDVEVYLDIFANQKIHKTIEVIFYPRLIGISSLKKKFLATEVITLRKIIKMKFKPSVNGS